MFNEFHCCHLCLKLSGSENSEICKKFLLQSDKFHHILKHLTIREDSIPRDKELLRKIHCCFPKSVIDLSALKKYSDKRSQRKEVVEESDPKKSREKQPEKTDLSKGLNHQKEPQKIIKTETNPDENSRYKSLTCKICGPERKIGPTSRSTKRIRPIDWRTILRDHLIHFHLPACHKCIYCNFESKTNTNTRKHCRTNHSNQPIEVLRQIPIDYDEKMAEMWLKCFDINGNSEKYQWRQRKNFKKSTTKTFCNGCQKQLVLRSAHPFADKRTHIWRSHMPARFGCPYCHIEERKRTLCIHRFKIEAHVRNSHPDKKLEILDRKETEDYQNRLRKLGHDCFGIEEFNLKEEPESSAVLEVESAKLGHDIDFVRCMLCQTIRGKKRYKIRKSSKKTLRKHIRNCHFPGRYKCPHCEYTSGTNRFNVLNHGKREHGNVEMEVLKDVCYDEEEMRDFGMRCFGMEIGV